MKKILFFLLIGELLIHSAKGQYVQSPTAYAYKAVEGRNALQGPVGCGEPADSVRSFYAPDSTRAAYYIDTCNNLFYYFNSKLQSWENITSGSGVVYMDTAYKINDSTTRYCKGATCWNISFSITANTVTIDTTITLDGTELLVTIPHGLSSIPDDIKVRVDNEAGLSTFVPPYFDATNIYIPYSIGPICTCEYIIKITP